MKFLRKEQLPILILNVIMLLFFGNSYLQKKNYEFIIYIGVIIFFFILILMTNKKYPLKNSNLWGLTFWAFLHLAGGFFKINETRLYEFVIIKIFENSNFVILRYDQFVHTVGFFVVTLIIYELIKKYLKEDNKLIYIILILAGLGAGAVNEIIELFTVLAVPETGVGGYYNTALDLVSDLIGAFLAVIWIRLRIIIFKN